MEARVLLVIVVEKEDEIYGRSIQRIRALYRECCEIYFAQGLPNENRSGVSFRMNLASLYSLQYR
jgi:hypothetical protein